MLRKSINYFAHSLLPDENLVQNEFIIEKKIFSLFSIKMMFFSSQNDLFYKKLYFPYWFCIFTVPWYNESLKWFLSYFESISEHSAWASQKRSSHVQITLTSKPFDLKFPDTTQMKDLSKSFLTITDFNKFFLNWGR